MMVPKTIKVMIVDDHPVVRGGLKKMLPVFDDLERFETSEDQTLALMNSEFMQQQSERFAARLKTGSGSPVERAWQLALGRAPSPDAPECGRPCRRCL